MARAIAAGLQALRWLELERLPDFGKSGLCDAVCECWDGDGRSYTGTTLGEDDLIRYSLHAYNVYKIDSSSHQDNTI